jgi:hypothetical protein
VTGRQICFRLRSYGYFKGEVVGYEALVRVEAKTIFRFAAFGNLQVTGSGTVQTDSYKSFYPPDPGGTTPSTPTAYSASNPYNNEGDVGSNGTVNISGGVTVNGTITPFAGQDIPTFEVPPTPLSTDPSIGLFTTGTYSSKTNTFSGSGTAAYNTALSGDAAYGSPTSYQSSANIVVSNATFGRMDIYVAPGATINVFITGTTWHGSSGPGNGFFVHNPAGITSTQAYGQVNFYITNPAAAVTLEGQAGVAALTDSPSAIWDGSGAAGQATPGPAAALAIYSNSVNLFKYAGGSTLCAAIYAPQSTFDMVGGTQIYGAVIADTIVAHGSAQFHYDESLANMRKQPVRPTYRIASLLEVVPKVQ